MALQDPEKHLDASQISSPATSQDFVPKLDPNGYPLQPQPSDDPLDPLNWKQWYKFGVLMQVCLLSLLNFFAQALANPAFGLIAKDLNVSITEASWTTTIAILSCAIAPLLLSPIANIYGRRPIYIYITVIAIIASAGSAVAASVGSELVARFFVGVGTGTGAGIGASCVADLYFQHERGRYTGIYIIFVTNGSHTAGIAGGFIGQYAGWRWAFWVATIALGVIWLVNIFFLPEKLYRRDAVNGQSKEFAGRTWKGLFSFRGVRAERHVRLWDFTHCFIMLRYPSVLLTVVYYSIRLGLGSVLFALTGAAAYGSIYDFNVWQIGLAIGVPTLVGSALGELLAGRVSDHILLLARRRYAGGNAPPEARLHCIAPGAFLLPAGVIIEGVCLQYRTHWSGSLMGIGIGAFGLQIVSTNVYAYLTDCYRPQSAELSTLLNFGRLIFGFTLGFYMIPFAMETTWGIAFATMAIIDVVLYAGILLLIWKGREWRERLGAPNFITIFERETTELMTSFARYTNAALVVIY